MEFYGRDTNQNYRTTHKSADTRQHPVRRFSHNALVTPLIVFSDDSTCEWMTGQNYIF